ncbi:hypothetical protein [Streptomyces diastatochromogenes]|uniref:hypothetical protein n=1 Tax=Streptomyces diastatochromogenes TaxID=42236 RepID=UPI00367A49F1
MHLLVHGIPAQACDALRQPDTAGLPRPRRHRAPSPAAWTDEAQRLLAADAQLPRGDAADLPRLRDALLSRSTTWTASAAPFSRIAAPRPAYDIPAICGPGKDSNAEGARTGPPGWCR